MVKKTCFIQIDENDIEDVLVKRLITKFIYQRNKWDCLNYYDCKK